MLAQAVELPETPNFDNVQSGNADPATQPPGASTTGQKKIPKWLQAGLSKSYDFLRRAPSLITSFHTLFQRRSDVG